MTFKVSTSTESLTSKFTVEQGKEKGKPGRDRETLE